jgi:RNA polymerase sigma factor (sigma-70 family)
MSKIPTREERFFEGLVESNRRAMLDFARARMRDASQAEDVIQDACFAAWEKIGDLMLSPNPGGWLMNALKICIRRHRKKEAKERAATEALTRGWVDDVAYPDDIDENLVAGILSHDDLRIAELREQGYGDSEIAELLGKTPGAIRMRLTRMRKKIAEFLDGETER